MLSSLVSIYIYKPSIIALQEYNDRNGQIQSIMLCIDESEIRISRYEFYICSNYIGLESK